MPTSHWFAAALSVLSLGVSGCAHPPPAVEMGFTHPVWTSDGLYLVERSGPGALFLTPPPAVLANYQKIILEDISLGFKEGIRELSAAEQTRAQSMIRRNMLRMLSQQGRVLADRPGPGTLRMRISVTLIDYPPNPRHGLSLLAVASGGNARITVELRDSLDGRRLLLYGQNRQFPRHIYSGTGPIAAQRLADVFIEYTLDLWRTIEKAERGSLAGPATLASVTRRNP